MEFMVQIDVVTVGAREGNSVGAGDSLGWSSCPKANKPAPLTLTSTALDPASLPYKAIPFFTFLRDSSTYANRPRCVCTSTPYTLHF